MKKSVFYEVENVETVNDIIDLAGKKYAELNAIKYIQNNIICEKTYSQLYQDIKSISAALIKKGYMKKNIALLGKNSYFLISSYLGIIYSGNIAIPLDRELSLEKMKRRIAFSDIVCILYDQEYSEEINILKKSFYDVKEYICFQNTDVLDECLEKYINDHLDITFPQNAPESVASILFTSGTLGESKGVMLTHQNLAKDAMCGCMSMKFDQQEINSFLILPLHHAYAFTCGVLSALLFGHTICINTSLKYLKKEMLLYKPHITIVVPLILEAINKSIWNEIRRNGKEKQVKKLIKISNFLFSVGIDMRRKFFQRILDGLGGNLETIVCGGAYMNPNMVYQFRELGINLLQGYGITECAPVVSSNIDRKVKAESVGRVYPCCCVKIVNNEIYVRGSIVMKGYYKNIGATQDAFDGEWFKTGDMGYLDEENYLYITGRKKNIIILSNGENIVPEELENGMCSSIPIIKEVVVYGDEQKDALIAEVFLDHDYITSEGIKDGIQYLNEKVKEFNSNLPLYKQIRKVIVREQEFEKTTTKKIIRKNKEKKNVRKN